MPPCDASIVSSLGIALISLDFLPALFDTAIRAFSLRTRQCPRRSRPRPASPTGSAAALHRVDKCPCLAGEGQPMRQSTPQRQQIQYGPQRPRRCKGRERTCNLIGQNCPPRMRPKETGSTAKTVLRSPDRPAGGGHATCIHQWHACKPT